MSWIGWAILGHLSNAAAFILDKALLSVAFKRGATYAALISILSFVVLAATPWVRVWPGVELLPLVVAFGGLQTLALWAFFEALRKGETSRVVPVVGSLVPVFTLVGTVTFANEVLTNEQYMGFGILIIATALLASGGSGSSRLSRGTVLLAIVAAALFAGSFVSGKIAYDRAEFLGVFVLSRVFVGLAGLSVGWLDGKARQELLSLFSFGGAPTRHRHATVLTIIAQLLGATGFVLLNVAIAEGSAAIVNALQAIQYTAIVLVAWFGGKQISALLQEQRTPLIFILKTAAIILVAIGLRLVSSPYQG